MSEYIKLFENEESSNGYAIKDVPFISTVLLNGGKGKVNLWATQQDKKIIVESGTPIVIVGKVAITGGTWDTSLTNKNVDVVISGDVALTGKTDCYSLTFATGGHLTINGGARLRVWEGGITNSDCTTVNYLTIVKDSVNVSYGEFLLHPNVTVNNHPLASVELISNSWYENASNYRWEYLGTPIYTTATSITSTVSEGNKYYAEVAIFKNNAYTSLGYIGGTYDNNPVIIAELANPFAVYNIISYRAQTEVPQKITISGDLVGNIDGNLNCNSQYSLFRNSYTSRIKSKYILNAIDNSVNILELQYPEQNGGSSVGVVTWISITRENIDEYPYLNPLAGFRLYMSHADIFTLSYKDIVWDPSFEE